MSKLAKSILSHFSFWLHMLKLNLPTCVSHEEERESTIAGHFPPNSKVTGVRCFAAADITICPTLALPANSGIEIDKQREKKKKRE